jgi:hypothetical protein
MKTIEQLFQERINSFIENKVLRKYEIQAIKNEYFSIYLPILPKFNIIKTYFLPFRISNYNIHCVSEENHEFEIYISFRNKIYKIELPS